MCFIIIFFTASCTKKPQISNQLKDLHQLAVDIGYRGSIDQWLDEYQVSQGALKEEINKDYTLYVSEGMVKWQYKGQYQQYKNLVSLYSLIDSKEEINPKSIEIRIEGSFIQWRNNNSNWNNLISLYKLAKPRAYSEDIIFNTNSYEISWKNNDDKYWNPLIDLESNIICPRKRVTKEINFNSLIEVTGYTVITDNDSFIYKPNFTGSYTFDCSDDSLLISLNDNEKTLVEQKGKITTILEKDQVYYYNITNNSSEVTSYNVSIYLDTYITYGNNNINDYILKSSPSTKLKFTPTESDYYKISLNITGVENFDFQLGVEEFINDDFKIIYKQKFYNHYLATNVLGVNSITVYLEEDKTYYINFSYPLEFADVELEIEKVEEKSFLSHEFNLEKGDLIYKTIVPCSGKFRINIIAETTPLDSFVLYIDRKDAPPLELIKTIFSEGYNTFTFVMDYDENDILYVGYFDNENNFGKLIINIEEITI